MPPSFIRSPGAMKPRLESRERGRKSLSSGCRAIPIGPRGASCFGDWTRIEASLLILAFAPPLHDSTSIQGKKWQQNEMENTATSLESPSTNLRMRKNKKR
ncbi:hypothetical protein KM043_004704 [Ampulex compressa]|nr:hypothetical protein KM043_004704 [Ampulex compressa]